MNISEAGIDLAREFEGDVRNIYTDGAGHKTVGIGHKVLTGEVFNCPLSDDDVAELFRKDCAVAVGAVNRLVKVQLTQNAFDALVDFTYNLGAGSLVGSTLLTLLNAGNYIAAANEFPRWDKERVNGELVESAGLARRRAAEKSLFLLA